MHKQVSEINCLWSSLSSDNKLLSVVRIRDWVGQLLARSVLQGTTSEGVALHGMRRVICLLRLTCLCLVDIVRDFTLASQSNTALQQLQRGFIQEVLKLADAGDVKRVTKDLKAYSTSSLSYHIASAIELPLASDELAQAWILHDNDAVVFQILSGIPTLKDLSHLAEHFSESGEHWSAARVYTHIAQRWKGLKRPEKLRNMRLSSQSLQQVPKEQQTPASVTLSMRHLVKIIMMSDSPAEQLKTEGEFRTLTFLQVIFFLILFSCNGGHS